MPIGRFFGGRCSLFCSFELIRVWCLLWFPTLDHKKGKNPHLFTSNNYSALLRWWPQNDMFRYNVKQTRIGFTIRKISCNIPLLTWDIRIHIYEHLKHMTVLHNFLNLVFSSAIREGVTNNIHIFEYATCTIKKTLRKVLG